MSKRILLVLAIAVMVLGSLVAACAPKPAPAPAPAPAPNPAPAPAPTPAPAPKPAPAPAPAPAQPPKVISWKLQSWAPEGYVHNVTMQEIGDKIKAWTGGAFELKVFPGDAIVPIAGQFDAMTSGGLDALLESPANQRDRFGAIVQLFDEFPGGLSSPEHLAWQYLGKQDGLQLIRQLYKDTNVWIVGNMSATGPEMEYWGNKKIMTIADYKGLKMRTGGGWAEALKGFGTSIVSMAGSEIYGAMQRGVIDAFEYGTPASDTNMGWWEVAKYAAYPGIHSPGAGSPMLYVNKNKWNELTPAIQQMLTDLCRETAYRDFYNEIMNDGAAIDFYKSKGMDVYMLPEPVQAALVQATDKLNDDYAAKDPFYKQVLESQRALSAKFAAGNGMVANFGKLRQMKL